ncbi:hypothetical protein [Halanaerobacter jeridensis]|uniref:Uncharacterized protein n=1 Tax=Halanaerobacter jeridensis TaxID=706427 RepID=A0A939BN46_9FIRM|nr:hypothetical protein [Halanaerobacter jeridensis]MBM7558170.1 hypothetical protein [Halanaerobacter jeridensis]
MSFDSILTMISIFIAVYSIIPKYKKLEIKLILRKADYLFIILAFLFIQYLLFYDVMIKLGLNLNLGLSKYNITPSNSSYIIVIIIFSYLFFRLTKGKISENKMVMLKETVEELQITERYKELIQLLNKNLNKLK